MATSNLASTVFSPAPSAGHTLGLANPWWSNVLLWLGCCACLLVIMLSAPLQSANDRSRWCTVWSLVERGTFQIDEIRQVPGWNTIDLLQREGHFYSTKPPALAVVTAGLTALVCAITGWSLIEHPHAVCQTVLLLLNGIPMMVALLAWRRIALRLGGSEWTLALLLVLAGGGTLLTPFLGTLNNHLQAAVGLVLAIDRSLVVAQCPEKRWSWLGMGLCLGWLVANELPALSLVALVTAWCVWCWPRRVAWLLAPLGGIAIAWLVLNRVATGQWQPAYASYGTSAYLFVEGGVPSYWMNPQGVDRNLDSPLVYLLHCTFGHHGIWSLTPVFLLTFAGWGWAICSRSCLLAMWNRAGLMCTAVVLAFYLSRTENYNYGGVSCALRWALWLVPLWMLAIIEPLNWCSRQRWRSGLVWLLVMGGCFSTWTRATTPWDQPWLFVEFERAGWINYQTPTPPLPRQQWLWIGKLPNPATLAEPATCEWHCVSTTAGTRRRKLTATRDADPSRLRLRCEEWSADNQPIFDRELAVLWSVWNSGEPPAKCIRWLDKEITSPQQQRDLAWLRGVPSLRQYSAGPQRYLKHATLPTALPCQRAATQVLFTPPGATEHRYRSEIWQCEQLPFGTARVDFSVMNSLTGEVHSSERWTLSDGDWQQAGAGQSKLVELPGQ